MHCLTSPVLFVKTMPWSFPYRVIKPAAHHFSEVVGTDQYHAKKYIKKGSLVIDAGANMGVFSMFAASLGATVYSFEPVAETFSILSRVTRDVPRIHPVNAGLGDSESVKKIYRCGDFGASTFEDSGMPPTTEFGFEDSHVTTIDSFTAQNGLTVDFIKIDCEGYEARILKGAAETIKRDKPVIAMSAYHHAEDKSELPRLLKSICPEYVCELSIRGEEDFICHI